MPPSGEQSPVFLSVREVINCYSSAFSRKVTHAEPRNYYGNQCIIKQNFNLKKKSNQILGSEANIMADIDRSSNANVLVVDPSFRLHGHF